jgi:hypothetical protein
VLEDFRLQPVWDTGVVSNPISVSYSHPPGIRGPFSLLCTLYYTITGGQCQAFMEEGSGTSKNGQNGEGGTSPRDGLPPAPAPLASILGNRQTGSLLSHSQHPRKLDNRNQIALIGSFLVANQLGN